MLSPFRSPFSVAALTLLAVGLLHGAARAETGRNTPGLVIDTGARHATCDQLLFRADGSQLLAVGEDKVVRRWKVGLNSFLDEKSINVRWPILREQRGSIFCMSYSHNGHRLAVGGFGVKNGLVAVLKLANDGGQVETVLSPVPSTQVNWAIAWSPSDRYVVYGNEAGELYRWEPGTPGATLFAASRAKKDARGLPVPNRVRLIEFLDNNHFLSVAMDGTVRTWDVRSPAVAPKAVADLKVTPVLRAVYNKETGLLAAAAGETTAAMLGRVDLLDTRTGRLTFAKLPPGRDTDRAIRCLALDSAGTRVAVGFQEEPKVTAKGDFFRVKGGGVLVYDTKKGWEGKVMPTGNAPEALAFHPIRTKILASAGGNNHEVRLWDSVKGELLGPAAAAVIRGPANCIWGVSLTKDRKYFAWKEARVTAPKHPNHQATGSWRVFDVANRRVLPAAPADFTPIAPIDSVPGWKVEPTPSPMVWRITGPGGVSVELKGGQGEIYNAVYNQQPRCWTFIPAGNGYPLRLAVGHQWGVSVYELRPGSVKLARVMTGHEGPVMCVAPSADGKLLITGGRDMTVCCWSLEKWTDTGKPDGKDLGEMGASFEARGGKLVVTAVAPGSPAWEPLNPLDGTDRDRNRLSKGDVIDFLQIGNDRFAYTSDRPTYETELASGRFSRITDRPTSDPKQALAKLRAVKPAQEYLMFKQVKGEAGKAEVVYKLTTVRQRPLWRFFATRSAVGNDWVIWRPRDFYYDTSAFGDRYVGWHVNSRDLNQTPAFHPLETYRGTDHVPQKGAPSGLHRPDKIWPTLWATIPPVDKVNFTEMEPPKVDLDLAELPAGVTRMPASRAKVPAGKAVKINVQITSRDLSASDQLLKKMVVWLNDTKLETAKGEDPLKPTALGRFKVTPITIDPARLQHGPNLVKVQCWNAKGGRGEAKMMFFYAPGTEAAPVLYGLAVGINNYEKAAVGKSGIVDLSCSVFDAIEMKAVLEQHKKSKTFIDAQVDLIIAPKKTDKEYDPTLKRAIVSRDDIIKRIAAIAAKVKPDDWFVLYMSGHGEADVKEDPQGRRPDGKPITTVTPRSYFYVCSDTQTTNDKTKLTSKDLYDALVKVRCRKIVILDTCRSGEAAKTLIPSDAVRDMSRDGKPMLIMASCQADEKALEPEFYDPKADIHNGYFTHSLLKLVGRSEDGKKLGRTRLVTFRDLREALPKELKQVFLKSKLREAIHHEPVFSLGDPEAAAVLLRPFSPAGGGGPGGRRR